METQREQDKIFEEILLKSSNAYGTTYPPNPEIISYLHQRDSAIRTSLLKELKEYCEHTSNCIRSSYSAGEPTHDGGYRQKFRGIWYEASPIDKTPKCDCGLDDLLTSYEDKQ